MTLLDSLSERIQKIAQVRSESLENFIALYLQHTGLNIDEIRLVEKRSDDGLKIEWYCEPKVKL